MKNTILTSSDHHSNWDALEHWFKVAAEKQIPFVINGDIIGDYNFEGVALNMGLTVPEQYSPTYKNGKQLKELYKAMVALHAKKLAQLIEKYQVQTAYLLGNHEPIFFTELTKHYLKNKELLIDLTTTQEITTLNGINIAGIPNTGHLQNYCYGILSENELNKIFSHLRSERKLVTNFDKEKINEYADPKDDIDWQRLKPNEKELDVFFTHGQIGRGEWRKEKKANETPTLLAAAKLSLNAKITIDGHLHTTHKMKNAIGKPTLRAVGNAAIILEKENNEMFFEDIKSEEPYEAKKQLYFSKKEFEEYKF